LPNKEREITTLKNLVAAIVDQTIAPKQKTNPYQVLKNFLVFENSPEINVYTKFKKILMRERRVIGIRQ